MASRYAQSARQEDALSNYRRSDRRARERCEAAEETGGPGTSFLAQEEDVVEVAELYPTDIITEADGVRQISPIGGAELTDSRKLLTGWSVARQRLFLEALAETGSVHAAAGEARLSARGAYRLRARSPAFARAWNAAIQVAVGRLSALAFDRAINGRLEQIYQNGALVAERRLPSDRMLTWLLSRLDPARFALPWERRAGEKGDPQALALAELPAALDLLTDLSTTPYDEAAPAPASAACPAGTAAAPRVWGLHACPPVASQNGSRGGT
jgi:hypothetical protein